MWFQRLVEIEDEPEPEPVLEPAERSAAPHGSVRTKKAKVVISTPADFQRVRLLSILRPKGRKTKRGSSMRDTLFINDVVALESEFRKNPKSTDQRKRQLAEDMGVMTSTIDVC